MLMQIESKFGRKMGRRREHHRDSRTGLPVVGLYKRPGDNRWTIAATGETFRCDDEVLAIDRFRQWERQHKKTSVAFTAGGQQLSAQSADVIQQAIEGAAQLEAPHAFTPHTDLAAIYQMDKGHFYAFMRELLLNNAVECAEGTGLPTLANFRDMPIPRASVKMSDLIAAYLEHAEVKQYRKNSIEKLWNKFTETTGAATVRDLTTESILKFRDAEVATGKTPETLKWIFAAIKGVFSFGLDRAFDAVEIRTALDKCVVLKAPNGTGTPKNPSPITREELETLLSKSDEFMQAAILIGLNFCLHPGEAMAVKWSEIDSSGKTFQSRRSKTAVIRAAGLWDRTIAALEKLPKRSEYVFTSTTGLNYSVSMLNKKFAELRANCEVPADLVFDALRDGAYTAACAAGVPMNLCMLLAGHKLPAEADHYVQRNPGMVKPATDAVEKHYFG